MQFASRSSDGFEEWETETAERVVNRWLRGAQRLGVDDEEDLIWMVLEHWWMKRGNFDPTGLASPSTYMKRVSENFLRDLWDKVQARRRESDRGTLSLDWPVVPGSDMTLSETILDTGPDIAWAVEQADLMGRARGLIGQLPVSDQEIVEALVDAPNVSVAARQLGLHRPTLYDHRRRIATTLEDAGLRDLLD